MANIITAPESGIYFDGNTAGVSNFPVLTGDASGVAIQYDGYAGIKINSAATGVNYQDRFSVEGANGRLFGVSDAVTGTVFSVNDAAGLPIIEVESTADYDKITIGEYGTDALVISGSSVEIGGETAATRDWVTGQGYVTASSEQQNLDNVLAKGNTSTRSMSVGAITGSNLTVGDSHFIGNQSTFDNLLLLSSAGENVVVSAANDIYLNTGGSSASSVGTTRLYISSSDGNVGVGTTSFVDTRAAGGLHIGNSKGIAFQATSSNANSRAWRIRNDDLADWGSLCFSVGTTNSDFADAASEVVMTMLRSGNVGIGTTTPNSLLTVTDSGGTGLEFIPQDSNNRNIIFSYKRSASQYKTLLFDASDYYFVTSGTNTRMLIADGGNVGIGTTDPFSKLTVARAGINEGSISFDDQANNAHLTLAGSDALVRLQMGTYNNGSYGAWIQGSYDNGGTNYGTEPLILNPQGGRVGIGTTNPLGLLMLRKDQTAPTRLIISNEGTVNASTSARLSFYEGSSEKHYIERRRDGSGKLAFVAPANDNPFVWENTSGEFMRFTDSNVGIGTVTPSKKLHIKGELGIERSDTTAVNTINSEGNFKFIASTGYAMTFVSQGSEMVRFYDGKVGIGTPTPAQKLTVNAGHILLSNNYDLRGTDTGGNQRTLVRINSSNEAEYGSSLNGPIKFMGGGSYTERMRIHTNGNIGIGTTSPDSTLHVQGPILVQVNASDQNSSEDSTTNPSTTTPEFMRIGHTGTYSDGRYTHEWVKLDRVGNLPLYLRQSKGTANSFENIARFGEHSYSTHRFQVFGSIAAAGATITGDILLGDYNKISGVTTDNLVIGVDKNNTAGGSSIDFQLDGSTSALFINNSRNIGIGTTSPTHKLDVRGDIVVKGGSTSHSVIRFRRSDQNYDFGYIGFEDPTAANDEFLISSAGNGNPIKIQAGTSDTIHFYGNTTAYGGFDGNGNLGVGTTAPSSKLTVLSSSTGLSADSQIKVVDSSLSYYGGLSYDQAGSTRFSIRNSYEGSSSKIGFGFGSSEDKVTILGDGNVGIGTTSPSSKLEVAGQLTLSQNSTSVNFIGNSSGNLTIDNDTGTIAFQADGSTVNSLTISSSLIKLNENVETPYQFAQGVTIANKIATYGAEFRSNNASAQIFFGRDGGAIGSGAIGADSTYVFRVYETTNFSTPFVVKQTGEVGIGTATPSGKLNIKASTSNGSTAFLVQNANSTNNFVVYDNGTILSAGAGRFQGGGYFTGGNVGIGTTSPVSTLNVSGLAVIGNPTGNNYNENLRLPEANSGWAALVLGGAQSDVSGTGTDQWTLVKYPTDEFAIRYNTTDRLYINTSGEVGIGTTSPSQKLDVVGNVEANTQNANFRAIDGGVITKVQSQTVGATQGVLGTESTNNLAIITSNQTRMFINTSGNVGIGTTASLDGRLNIADASSSNVKVTRIANDVTTVYRYATQADAVLEWTCGSYFHAEVVITASQTNSGGYNNLYIRGIWSNNYTSHHWDELEHIGGLTGSTFTITNGQNGSSAETGRLTLTFDYTSGSFSTLNVRITDFYGSHSYTIS